MLGTPVGIPTASLHLDAHLLATFEAQGVERTTLTLHVGKGTFEPLRSDEM